MIEGLIIIGVVLGSAGIILWACLTVDKEDVINDK